VALQVDDDGTGAADGRANGTGSGLAGLAERARPLHGRLEAGARPGGGFRLRLTVPLEAT
jgi:signal transduction histidine kinase